MSERLTQHQRVQLSARRLLQAAAALIVEKGWEATTAAEIGRRAGYSRAMVHARYGSKDAILEAFQQVYVARLNPEPEPGCTGLQQVLAHFDRVQEIHAEDAAVTRAMFVSAFEAAKTSSPLRAGVREQLSGAAEKVGAGLRTGIADGSLRPDLDIDAAVRDITGSIFGIAFAWVVLPEQHDLDHEIDLVRNRIISTYGS
ncbi:TetR/AcrR family transcriptional regulator [Mycobacterium sp. MBM]|nr:TetR/AcrR family transcriptional regulator [Mycobacterium sp. MBM]